MRELGSIDVRLSVKAASVDLLDGDLREVNAL
jgi:hypothetical protein